MAILVTGVAGFIGFNLARQLLLNNQVVIGIDNLNDYYDPKLKKDRLNTLRKIKNNEINFLFYKLDLIDKSKLENIFKTHEIKYVINLAAQAGVRYSLINPTAYINSNILGFSNILELCKTFKVHHLIYASSSSVYGGNSLMPFSESHGANHPVSLYAATKRSNELMAHSYAHLFNLPCTGLRFFTVYGPWGRPDMALFIFTKAIIENNVLEVFNHGNMKRDFTYIGDIVEALIRMINKPPLPNKDFDKDICDPASSWAPHKVFNIGNSSPTKLEDYISAIEQSLDMKAIKKYMPMQPGDVEATFADTSKLEEWIDYKPRTSVKEGVSKFIEWYREYYNVD
tara:strand:+ start:1248 stop:2270 length:1023 start_codon:yes stop_codon:yes gene_type:complete